MAAVLRGCAGSRPREDRRACAAFEVDDLEHALRGQDVIVPPNSPSAGVIVAFIKVAGAPVELLQIDWTIRTDL